MAILTNYLKGIADAIRAKKNTDYFINAQNFAEEIRSIVSEEFNDFLRGTLKEIVIPEDVTQIRAIFNDYTEHMNIYLHKNIRLTSFLPQSKSNYQNLYFDGTLEQWKSLSSSLNNQPIGAHYLYIKNNNQYELLKELNIDTSDTPTITDRFMYNIGVEKIIYSDNSTRSGSFKNSVNLKEVDFKNLTTIESQAFYSCPKLTLINIPSSVTSIGSSSFATYESGDKITIIMNSANPPTIQSNSFNNSRINKIFVPSGSGSLYRSATNWSNLSSKIFEPNESIYLNVDSTFLNNANYTYSLDNGSTWQQFTSESMTLEYVKTIKFKSLDSSVVMKIGTTDGGNELGTIANATSDSYTTTNGDILYIKVGA